MANTTFTDPPSDTSGASMGSPGYVQPRVFKGTGSFGATQGAETNAKQLTVGAFRNLLISFVSTAWGTATVVYKIYPCDSSGNKTGNAFFTITITANGTQVVYMMEMGGTSSTATWPATSQTSGLIVGPFGSYILITEQCTAFTSGTNTVAVEVDCKG